MGPSVGQVNLQYLAGYDAVIETWLVVPLNGEPTLLLAIPFHVTNARAISYVKALAGCPGPPLRDLVQEGDNSRGRGAAAAQA